MYSDKFLIALFMYQNPNTQVFVKYDNCTTYYRYDDTFDSFYYLVSNRDLKRWRECAWLNEYLVDAIPEYVSRGKELK